MSSPNKAVTLHNLCFFTIRLYFMQHILNFISYEHVWRPAVFIPGLNQEENTGQIMNLKVIAIFLKQ